MKTLIYLSVSIVLLLNSGCCKTETVYVTTPFPYIPEYNVSKVYFEPLVIDYEVTK